MAGLPAGDRLAALFDPYRQDQDQGDKSNYAVFSDGPYKLEGKWNKNKGGTFVRNTKYDPKTDDRSARRCRTRSSSLRA